LSDRLTVNKGFVVEPGIRLPFVSFLTQGRMRLLVCLPGLREVWVTDLSTGSVLGLASAVLGRPEWTTAVVVESCHVRTIPAARLRELLITDASVALWTARALAAEVLHMHAAVGRFGACAEARLHLHFASLSLQGAAVLPDGSFRLFATPSQDDLAQAIGVTRQHVSHLLADGERAGTIRRQNGRYIIPSDSLVLDLRASLIDASDQPLPQR
jgi:CRP-like cAMP-binding protein